MMRLAMGHRSAIASSRPMSSIMAGGQQESCPQHGHGEYGGLTAHEDMSLPRQRARTPEEDRRVVICGYHHVRHFMFDRPLRLQHPRRHVDVARQIPYAATQAPWLIAGELLARRREPAGRPQTCGVSSGRSWPSHTLPPRSTIGHGSRTARCGGPPVPRPRSPARPTVRVPHVAGARTRVVYLISKVSVAQFDS